MASMKSIIEELTALVYRDDDCNCGQCFDLRTEKIRNEFFLRIYPALPFMPRNHDWTLMYNGQDHNALHVRGEERYREIMRGLKHLKEQNTFEMEFLHDDGVPDNRITYCLDCGKAVKKLKKHRFYAQLEGDNAKERYYMCKDCHSNYGECRDCQKIVRSNTLHTVFDTKKEWKKYTSGDRVGSKYARVCRECWNAGYRKCILCGIYTGKDKLVEIDAYGHRGPQHMCSECEKKDRIACTGCGEHTHKAICMIGNDDRSVFCAQCWEARVPIHNHDYKPSRFNFRNGRREGKVTDNALHFGFELEIERRDSAISREAMAELAKERFGARQAYVVHDGSLNDGIEIVSHPVTWDRYVTDKDKWNDLMMYIRNKGWGTKSTCGFHVHMTKAAFKQFQLFKFLKFFHSKDNKTFIDLIAGRKGNKYARFSEADSVALPKVVKNKKNQRGGGGNMHYNAINLMSNDTLEIRIFKGTTEPLVFHKDVEFCQALYEFSMTHSTSEMGAKFFKDYALANRKRFPALHEYLTMPSRIRNKLK